MPPVSSATRPEQVRAGTSGPYAEAEGDLVGVRRVEDLDPPRPQLGLEPAGVGVGDGQLVLDHQHPAPGADLVEPGAYGVSVGPHQAAGAEQHPAEPAGHHHDDVGDLAAAEHLEHRRARGAGRLTVVAGALHVAGRPEHERGAVVPRVPVLPAQPLDDRPCGCLVGDPLHRAQEARPLHLDLGGAGPGHGEIGRHAHRPSTSPPIRTMNAETTTTKKIRTKRTPLATATRAPR